MGATATIVVTDLVGSTRLRAELGEQAADELRRVHDERLREVAERHGGTVIKGTGDGLIVSFTGAAEALHACVSMQQVLVDIGRRRSQPLAMRIGVSAGDVSFEEGDCFGTPVIEASRLCSAADDGTIYVAKLVRALARGRSGLEFSGASELDLKGLPEPVLAHVLAWEPAPLGSMEIAVAGPWVGRERELSLLSEAFDRARGGLGQTVFVRGEPGIGKSRTVTEFVRRVAEPADALVLWGSCHDGDVVANGPFAEALTAWGRTLATNDLRVALGHEAPVLLRLAPGLHPLLPDVGPPLPVPPEAEAGRLRDSVAQLVIRLAAARPIVLVLDDLHWADGATVATLRTVARDTRAARVLIVGPYRDTDLDRRHPFAEGLSVMHREVEPVRIDLAGLDREEVRDLLEEAAGQPVTDDFAELLAAETDGNPFFLRETLLHLVEEGRVVHDGEGWVLAGGLDQLGVPAGVREVVGRRLSRLSDDANALLAIGSLSEVSMSLPIVAAVAGLDEARALDAIDEATKAQILRPAATFDDYEFTHALFRHVLREELNPSRQVRLHRSLAEAIEARAGASPTPQERAALLRHYERSAALPGAERGVEHAFAVADDAAGRFAPFEEYVALTSGVELIATGDPRRPELLARRAASAIAATIPDEVRLAAAAEAVDAAARDGGPRSARAVAAHLLDLATSGGQANSRLWGIAHLGARFVGPDDVDADSLRLRLTLAYEREFMDPAHPGIPQDSPERRAIRSAMLALDDGAFERNYVPLASREEALDFVARFPPGGVDAMGVAMFPWSAMFVLGQFEELADECDRSMPDLLERGWLDAAVNTGALAARLRCVLGHHDRSDECMAAALHLLSRLPETTNAPFQALGGDMLRQEVRGGLVSSDELAAIMPFVDLPDTAWAGLALRAAYARTLALEGRRDEALQALASVVESASVAAGWAQNYPMILAHVADALWALDSTQGLEVVERNLRAKVIEPDLRYPEVDARRSLALLCGLTGRIDEARTWFDRSRATMAEQGTEVLTIGIDLDAAILEQRVGGPAAQARGRELLEQAHERAQHPALAAWLPRIEAVAG